jgi:predicted RNase H-like HicB family nuclease
MRRTIEITVELTPDLEVGGYVAYCPELDITTEGETIEEAMAMMKEAAEGYLDVVGLDTLPTVYRHFNLCGCSGEKANGIIQIALPGFAGVKNEFYCSH